MTHRLVFERDGVNSPSHPSLPPVSTKRWVVRRKAQVVAAIAEGRLSVQDACERYALTLDELLGWQSFVERHGLEGLRVTRLQHYRVKPTAHPRTPG